jgi:curved DNA-binding protein CbpA
VIIDELIEAYRTLGISTDSPLSEINKTYRKLAKRFHPDSNAGNPDYSHDTIVRINEAYDLIKESYKRESRFSEFHDYEVSRGIYNEGIKKRYTNYDYLKARAREQKRKREEKEKKEREALKKIIEKTVIERKNEIRDEKYFRHISNTAYELISCYFDKNFNNEVFRTRPQTEIRFKKYIKIYDRQLEEIKSITPSFRSKLHRQRADNAYEFLQSFIDDAVKGCSVDVDRRAHAYQGFRRAVGAYEKFLIFYFSGRKIEMEEILQMFKKSLDAIENFLQSFPESPLTRFAEIKIIILDSMYRAFLKKV